MGSIVEPDSLANVENLWAKEANLEADEATNEALAKRNLAPVTDAQAKEMATKIGAKGYFETSAKENLGGKEVFEEAARLACEGAAPKPKSGPFDCCVIV